MIITRKSEMWTAHKKKISLVDDKKGWARIMVQTPKFSIQSNPVIVFSFTGFWSN